ncbi:MAG: DUF2330 domain-containing protein [Myxococcota bacterium]
MRFVCVLSLVALAPSTALACGGFFCSTQPIEQSAERIVFGVDAQDGTIETHVQIAYQGTAEDFAWVVPVPAIPDLFLSTDTLFQSLSSRTQPRFFLDARYDGQCEFDGCGTFGAGCFAEADAGSNSNANGGDDGVTVVAEENVGPYDTVTLQADSAELLLTWLQDNGYQLPDTLMPVLEPYVMASTYFVALRLSQNEGVGDLAPLGMRYAAATPMIPIQLTSIAASPDMRLEVYVLGEARAVPDNYLHVQINEAAIDWFTGGRNYNDVITRAADEAGGQAFATDFAGTTESLGAFLFAEGRFDTGALAQQSDPAAFVDGLLSQGFPRNTQMQGLLRKYIPMPAELVEDGVDERDFYNCLRCYSEALGSIVFDPVAFAAELEERVVAPLRDAQATFDRLPYLTRLTSSVSPEEMTVDPTFVFNRELGDLDNVRRATLIYECGAGTKLSEAQRRIELSDGTVIRLEPEATLFAAGQSSSDAISDLEAPAAAVIEQTGADGLPTTLEDNRPEIAARVDQHNNDVPRFEASGGTCAATPPSLLLLLLLRRRRS